MRQLAHHDSLTGVLNRRGLDDAFEQLPTGGGLLLVDFDDLKRLNESVGYDAGDEVLAMIGHTLRDATGETELVGRLGGDEFVLLIPEASASELQLRARQLAELLDAMPVPANAQLHYRGASVGATLSKPGESPQLLIRRATEQMRLQKHRRKSDRRGHG